MPYRSPIPEDSLTAPAASHSTFAESPLLDLPILKRHRQARLPRIVWIESRFPIHEHERLDNPGLTTGRARQPD